LATTTTIPTTTQTFEQCTKTSALTLANYLGRTFEVRSCLEAGFVNSDLVTLTDAWMNASLARVLRDIYSSCVRSFEQPNYFLGYFANWNNGLNDHTKSIGGPGFPSNQDGVVTLVDPTTVRALLLGAGNTVSTAYVISRPANQDLVYYTPSMKKSDGIGATAGNFLIYQRPWFVNFFFPNAKATPGWFTYYEDATVVNQNDSTICYPASTAGSYNNVTPEVGGFGYAGALVCLDFRIPPMPTCGGYSIVLRNWGYWANLLTIDDPIEEWANADQRAQFMSVSPGTPGGVVTAVRDSLFFPDGSVQGPRFAPTEHFSISLTKAAFPSLSRDGKLYFMAAGTHGGYSILKEGLTSRWYVIIFKYNGLL